MSDGSEWEAVRGLVSSGDQNGALDRLARLLQGRETQLYNEVLVQTARVADLRRRERAGQITDAAASTERNRITIAILELIDEAARKPYRPPPIEPATVAPRTPAPGPQDAPTSPSVFVSFVTEDAPRALEVAEALSKAGLRSWIDRTGLRIGDEWHRVLRSKILECDYCIVLQSRNLRNRSFSYVYQEIDVALEKQVRAGPGVMYLLPVLLDDAEPAEPLRHLQSKPLRDEADLRELVRVIFDDFDRRQARRPVK